MMASSGTNSQHNLKRPLRDTLSGQMYSEEMSQVTSYRTLAKENDSRATLVTQDPHRSSLAKANQHRRISAMSSGTFKGGGSRVPLAGNSLRTQALDTQSMLVNKNSKVDKSSSFVQPTSTRGEQNQRSYFDEMAEMRQYQKETYSKDTSGTNSMARNASKSSNFTGAI